jgi:hypothetical protein
MYYLESKLSLNGYLKIKTFMYHDNSLTKLTLVEMEGYFLLENLLIIVSGIAYSKNLYFIDFFVPYSLYTHILIHRTFL